MAKTIKPSALASALGKELTLYGEDLVEKLDKLSEKAVKDLVDLTKATAPAGKRGAFRRSIDGMQLDRKKNGVTYVWYVKKPNYRLTHLLVHGHATKDGGRTRANPFLRNALDVVLPEYERAVEEAIKK